MNTEYCGEKEVLSGVDLNRNYGYHYGQNQEGADQCSESYRGPNAFSEPETQAIKKLVEKYPTIVSAMNFHTYGNMWIRPFNFLDRGESIPKNIKKKFLTFYDNFGKDVQIVSPGALYGNAIEMVDYKTDGEATDWMFGEKEIIAFSPELGSKNPDAQTFFCPKDLIFEVIQENYKVVDLFLSKNVFNLSDLSYYISDQNKLVISFHNSGLTHIFNSKFKL